MNLRVHSWLKIGNGLIFPRLLKPQHPRLLFSYRLLMPLRFLNSLISASLLTCSLAPFTHAAEPAPAPAFPQILPPVASKDAVPSTEQQAALKQQLVETEQAFQAVKDHPRAADVDIFLKAGRYALEFQEWYDKKPEDCLKKADKLLTEAGSRIESLKQNKTPWLEKPGRTVLGFYSNLDDSPQPYGVEIPEGLEWGKGKKETPIWVWLHGRGDKQTDLNYLASQLSGKAGEFKTSKAIIIHPFGRYCNGYKSAGEVDVLEATQDAVRRFHGDVNRIALMGFSMGGAGAWHMGAHYTDQWAVVHTGAGFVDVKRYLNITPDKLPPSYEQTLWSTYDVPDYARNFMNVPLVSYSGEKDKQRDSAEYMTEVLAAIGQPHTHLIGPGMEHKYHPEVRERISKMIEGFVEKGRNPWPRKITLQSRSARYTRMHWAQIMEVESPWADTRLDAELEDGTDILSITTANVKAFAFQSPWKEKNYRRYVAINGQLLEFEESSLFEGAEPAAVGQYYAERQQDDTWQIQALDTVAPMNRKAGGTSIDDAFNRRFVIVLPDKPGRHPAVDAWVKAESEHFIQRWRKLMRGDPLVVKASEVGTDLARSENLILFGDDVSNACIAQRMKHLPLTWSADKVGLKNGKTFDAATHVPVLIYPEEPAQPGQPYVVINSGLTFREGHDRTNSLQNPKLPDWAILNITTPPNGDRAGEVVEAGFFDARWR